MGYLDYQKPLEWSEFQRLMSQLDHDIQVSQGIFTIRLACRQTAIALGCYLGLGSKELLLTRWNEVSSGWHYRFKYEKNRNSIPLDRSLKKIIRKNRLLISPERYSYILPDPFKSDSPISAMKFNNILKQLLEKYHISTPEPSTLTLRKTYILKVWEKNGRSDKCLEGLSKELGYDLPTLRLFVKK